MDFFFLKRNLPGLPLWSQTSISRSDVFYSDAAHVNVFCAHYQSSLCNQHLCIKGNTGTLKQRSHMSRCPPSQFIFCDLAAIHLLNALSWFPLCTRSRRWPWKLTVWCILMIIYSHIQETVSLTWFSGFMLCVICTRCSLRRAASVFSFPFSNPF